MPLDVGKYEQGGKRTVPDFEPEVAQIPTAEGSPARGQAVAHPTPKGTAPQDLQEPIHTSGANAIRK